MMNKKFAGVKGGEGEEVPLAEMVENEERVEELFGIAEQRGGLPWRKKGILPLLVFTAITSWRESFPTWPFVVRGPVASKLCDLTGEAKSAWNRGATLFSTFVDRTKAVVHRSSVGNDNPGFKGCLTYSFELADKFIHCLPPPNNVVLRSKALLAAKGPWFTAANIEWGGGESIAKLESGRKIWIIATNAASSKFLMSIESFEMLYRFLTEPKQLYTKKRKLIRGLRYHLAQPGDVVIQPPLCAHIVLTGRSLNSDGTVQWALVHGWEGINVADSECLHLVQNLILQAQVQNHFTKIE